MRLRAMRAAAATPTLCRADKLFAAITQSVFASDHRQSVEVPADIVGELRHGRIAARRLLAHRHEDDVVEIAAQQFRDLGFRTAEVVESCEHGSAGPFRFLFRDGARDLLGRARLQAVGPLTGQEFVEQHA